MRQRTYLYLVFGLHFLGNGHQSDEQAERRSLEESALRFVGCLKVPEYRAAGVLYIRYGRDFLGNDRVAPMAVPHIRDAHLEESDPLRGKMSIEIKRPFGKGGKFQVIDKHREPHIHHPIYHRNQKVEGFSRSHLPQIHIERKTSTKLR